MTTSAVLEKRAPRFRFNPQYLAPLLVTAILAAGQLSSGILLGYRLLLTAILAHAEAADLRFGVVGERL